jgi:hypothetical protein
VEKAITQSLWRYQKEKIGKCRLGIIIVRSEVFTAVSMKNAVFWDIKIHFVPHRRHVTSLLLSPAG